MHNPTNMAKFIKIVENLNYIFILRHRKYIYSSVN